MDAGALSQMFEANKVPILATAGAGVAGFALYQRHKTTKAGAAPAAAGTSTDGGVSVSAGGQLAGMNGANAYDSSSSDVYGLIQPQLESLGGQLTDLAGKVNAIPVTRAPAPAPTPAPAPAAAAAAPVYAAPAPAPVPVYAVDQQYTIRPGDNLSAIAARFPQQDITWQSIYNANRGVIGGNPGLIRPGQVIHITG